MRRRLAPCRSFVTGSLFLERCLLAMVTRVKSDERETPPGKPVASFRLSVPVGSDKRNYPLGKPGAFSGFFSRLTGPADGRGPVSARVALLAGKQCGLVTEVATANSGAACGECRRCWHG